MAKRSDIPPCRDGPHGRRPRAGAAGCPLSPIPCPLLVLTGRGTAVTFSRPVPRTRGRVSHRSEPDVIMELREFLAEDAIALDLEGESKDEILKELIGLLGVDEKS